MLGRGAFGVVSSVDHQGTVVACKTVAASDTTREIDICTRLMRNGHPNIVQIIKVESTKLEDRIYMEIYPSDLRRMLTLLASENFRIKETNAIRVVHGLAGALEHLKSMNIMHRDLKPENVLIRKDYIPLLCDFGCSKIRENNTNTTYIVSRFYRAPELLLERWYSYEVRVPSSGSFFRSPHGATSCAHLLFQVDIWSLGCLAVELCIGAPLFMGNDTVEQLVSILRIRGSLTNSDLKSLKGDTELSFPMDFSLKAQPWSRVPSLVLHVFYFSPMAFYFRYLQYLYRSRPAQFAM